MFDKPSRQFNLPAVPPEDWAMITASDNDNGDWRNHETEGQLSVDVAQTKDELLVIATIAGASPDKIELHLHNDLLTIRGERYSPAENAEHFYNECYWGKFSRSIVLPVDVKPELTKAQYKNGLLVIRLAKNTQENEIPILIIEE